MNAKARVQALLMTTAYPSQADLFKRAQKMPYTVFVRATLNDVDKSSFWMHVNYEQLLSAQEELAELSIVQLHEVIPSYSSFFHGMFDIDDPGKTFAIENWKQRLFDTYLRRFHLECDRFGVEKAPVFMSIYNASNEYKTSFHVIMLSRVMMRKQSHERVCTETIMDLGKEFEPYMDKGIYSSTHSLRLPFPPRLGRPFVHDPTSASGLHPFVSVPIESDLLASSYVVIGEEGSANTSYSVIGSIEVNGDVYSLAFDGRNVRDSPEMTAYINTLNDASEFLVSFCRTLGSISKKVPNVVYLHKNSSYSVITDDRRCSLALERGSTYKDDSYPWEYYFHEHGRAQFVLHTNFDNSDRSCIVFKCRSCGGKTFRMQLGPAASRALKECFMRSAVADDKLISFGEIEDYANGGPLTEKIKGLLEYLRKEMPTKKRRRIG